MKICLKEELEEELAKYRRRVLGNICFIGELFNLSMLKETVLNQCCRKLLYYKTSDSLESICRLLTTCGCNLEKRIKNLKDASEVQKGFKIFIQNLKLMFFYTDDFILRSNRSTSH